MANLSSLTRREQVFGYLKARMNAWVDGPELANEVVGGSEGLKRLRELRAELKGGGRYEIEMRGHPDPGRDIFQYRLVDRPLTDHRSGAAYTVEKSHMEGDVRVIEKVRLHSVSAPPVEIRRNAGRVVYDPESDSYVAVYDGPMPLPEPQVTGQVDMGVPEAELHKYTRKPTKLELGVSIICPMCKGIHRAIKEKDAVTGKAAKQGKILGYEEMTRDPRHPSKECPRCDGWGLIPA